VEVCAEASEMADRRAAAEVKVVRILKVFVVFVVSVVFLGLGEMCCLKLKENNRSV